ncbi:MAG: hypothetical protein R3F49_10950 [Planctomycetota bacterium]
MRLLVRALRRQRLALAILFKSTLRDALLARATGARGAGFRREGNRALLPVAVKLEAGRHYTRSYAYLPPEPFGPGPSRSLARLSQLARSGLGLLHRPSAGSARM